MTIQSIGTASVALYISQTDLNAHCLTPAGLTLERALEFTHAAFREAGITLDGSIEIEAYPEACGVLVFAHVKVPQRVWFSFSGLEPLLDAVQTLPAPRPDAALLWWDGRYWLSLPGDAQQAANHLSEFGRCEDAAPALEARLAEHGTPIAEGDALAVLARHFLV